MSTHNFLVPTILVLATILIVFGMKYISGARQTRLRLAGEDQFRLMAQKAIEAQTVTAEALTTARTEIADVKRRLTSIETMLREVG
jgi:hypothetical protein